MLENGFNSLAVSLTLDEITNPKQRALAVQETKKQAVSVQLMHNAIEPKQAADIPMLVFFAKLDPFRFYKSLVENHTRSLCQTLIKSLLALWGHPPCSRFRIGLGERDKG